MTAEPAVAPKLVAEWRLRLKLSGAVMVDRVYDSRQEAEGAARRLAEKTGRSFVMEKRMVGPWMPVPLPPSTRPPPTSTPAPGADGPSEGC